MFGKFKKNKNVDVHAVSVGVVKPLCEVSDAMFAQGMIGRGIAITPRGSRVVSPITGTLSVVFPTGHAFGITSEDGLEFLVHIGVDTVSLKGEGFSLLVKQGQSIKAGEPLVDVDYSVLEKHELSTDIMVVVTSTDTVCEVESMLAKDTDITETQAILYTCVKK